MKSSTIIRTVEILLMVLLGLLALFIFARPVEGQLVEPGPSPPSVELPGVEVGVVLVDRVTPFTLRARWFAPERHLHYLVGIAPTGGGEVPGRFFLVSCGCLPASSGRFTFHRLAPDTEYRITVHARDGMRQTLVGTVKARTASVQRGPLSQPIFPGGSVVCGDATRTTVGVKWFARCRFGEYRICVDELWDEDILPHPLVFTVKVPAPVKEGSIVLEGLTPGGYYAVTVYGVDCGQAYRIGVDRFWTLPDDRPGGEG